MYQNRQAQNQGNYFGNYSRNSSESSHKSSYGNSSGISFGYSSAIGNYSGIYASTNSVKAYESYYAYITGNSAVSTYGGNCVTCICCGRSVDLCQRGRHVAYHTLTLIYGAKKFGRWN